MIPVCPRSVISVSAIIHWHHPNLLFSTRTCVLFERDFSSVICSSSGLNVVRLHILMLGKPGNSYQVPLSVFAFEKGKHYGN